MFIINTQVVSSFKEIVPLLEAGHLILFWRFYQKLVINEHEEMKDGSTHRLEDLFYCLNQKQISICFQQYCDPNAAINLPSSPSFKKQHKSNISVQKEELSSLSHAVISHISECYAHDPKLGDGIMKGNLDLLLANFYIPEEQCEHEIELKVIPPFVAICTNSFNSVHTCIRLLQSCVFTPKLAIDALATLYMHWASNPFLEGEEAACVLSNIEARTISNTFPHIG